MVLPEIIINKIGWYIWKAQQNEICDEYLGRIKIDEINSILHIKINNKIHYYNYRIWRIDKFEEEGIYIADALIEESTKSFSRFSRIHSIHKNKEKRKKGSKGGKRSYGVANISSNYYYTKKGTINSYYKESKRK